LAPSEVSAVGEDAGALVSWTAPSSTGGEPITGYLITATPGGASVLTEPESSTKYRFTVAAVTAAGTGPASKPSKPVLAAAPAPPVLAKKSVTVKAANEAATVAWGVSEAAASAPVTGYLVTANPGAITREAPPSVQKPPSKASRTPPSTRSASRHETAPASPRR